MRKQTRMRLGLVGAIVWLFVGAALVDNLGWGVSTTTVFATGLMATIISTAANLSGIDEE